MCGYESIPWSQIGLFSIILVKHDLLQYVGGLNGALTTGCVRARNLDSMKDMNDIYPRQRSLLSALVDGRDANATMLRDKVYGIMELSSELLDPDYSAATDDSEIFRKAVLASRCATLR